jgi:hypothetical protein
LVSKALRVEVSAACSVFAVSSLVVFAHNPVFVVLQEVVDNLIIVLEVIDALHLLLLKVLDVWLWHQVHGDLLFFAHTVGDFTADDFIWIVNAHK